MKELERLETKLQEKKVTLDSFFDRANKLRFLQANKFKASNTVEAMVEYTKWRATSFPVRMTAKIEQMLVNWRLARIRVRFTSAAATTSTAPSLWPTSASSTPMTRT